MRTSLCVACGLLLLACSELAWAQRPANQSGRLFDANPQLGGARQNTPRPDAPRVGGNLSATGNIRAGQSLRSFSPIQDPLAFRGSLGSGALSAFIRDSTGVADSAVYRTPVTGSAFFDPARTAPTVGYLSGVNSGAAREPFARRNTPGLLNYDRPALDSRSNFAPRIDAPALSRSRGELSSTLFGVRPGAVPGLIDTQVPAAPGGRTSAANQPRLDDGASDRRASVAPLDLRASGPGFTPIGQPLDSVLRADANALLTQSLRRPRFSGGLEGPRAAPGLAAESPLGGPAPRDTSVLPGQSVFGDMRLAMAAARDPNGEWLRDMERSTPRDPTPISAAAPSAAGGARDAREQLAELLARPLRTFVGASGTAVNHELASAEAALHDGDFYGAAARFERASLYDPLDPLPLIGRAHASLAAGEYLSAVVFLTRGLERFPDMSRFALDLEALLGGGEMVDIRRADIMRRLEAREDPQLRFLLGYIELHTGNRESGLKNLELSAGSAELNATLRLYATRLREGLREAAPSAPRPVAPQPDAPNSGAPTPPPLPSEERENPR